MVLLSTIISFVNCSLHFLYRKYWIFRTYNFTCSLIPHINVSIEVSFIWRRRFVHCVGFLTIYTGFYTKSLHSPLCSMPGIIYLLRSQPKDKAINEQLGAWSFADTFRTAEKRNLSRFQAKIHWMLHFWDTSDALESPKSSLVFFQSVRFFTTQCKEDP